MTNDKKHARQQKKYKNNTICLVPIILYAYDKDVVIKNFRNQYNEINAPA